MIVVLWTCFLVCKPIMRFVHSSGLLSIAECAFLQEGKLTEEQFAASLQTTLNSPPQPNLVGFLKVSDSKRLMIIIFY